MNSEGRAKALPQLFETALGDMAEQQTKEAMALDPNKLLEQDIKNVFSQLGLGPLDKLTRSAPSSQTPAC